jgi:hypothetical protein
MVKSVIHRTVKEFVKIVLDEKKKNEFLRTAEKIAKKYGFLVSDENMREIRKAFAFLTPEMINRFLILIRSGEVSLSNSECMDIIKSGLPGYPDAFTDFLCSFINRTLPDIANDPVIQQNLEEVIAVRRARKKILYAVIILIVIIVVYIVVTKLIMKTYNPFGAIKRAIKQRNYVYIAIALAFMVLIAGLIYYIYHQHKLRKQFDVNVISESIAKRITDLTLKNLRGTMRSKLKKAIADITKRIKQADKQ